MLQSISNRGLSPFVVLNGCVTEENYISILGDLLQPMFQTVFPEKQLDFQNNRPTHTGEIVQDWFYENNYELEHFMWCHQVPVLDITESLWGGILENKMRG